MAKKKKVEPTYDFVPPPFDEKEFIKKDLVDSKVVIIATVFGIIIGALAAAATIYISGILGFLIIVLMTYGMFKLLFRALDIDISGYQRRDYIYKGGTYLITAIALWVLLLNPPFAYTTPPTVHPQDVKVYQNAGTLWTPVNLSSTNPISPGEVNFTAQVLSIGSVTATIYITHNTSSSSAPMVHVSGSQFQYKTSVSAGTYSFYILAKSSSGQQSKSATFAFSVS